MKLTCSRDDILKEISVAQEVISSKIPFRFSPTSSSPPAKAS